MSFIRPRGWGAGIASHVLIHKESLLPGLLDQLQPDWWYNWQAFRFLPDLVPPNYIPMLWDGQEALSGKEQLESTLSAQPDRIWQFMNEPENPHQANKSPQTAFEGLKAFLRLAWDTGVTGQYAAPGVEMSPRGLAWAVEFFSICRQHFVHRPAYITVHCYLNGQLQQNKANWDAMWSRFWEFHQIWTPATSVIVSEVCAVNRSFDDQKRIMDLARETLETDDRVAGVAWYIANTWPGDIFPNACLSTYDAEMDTMSLTPLGQYWRSLK